MHIAACLGFIRRRQVNYSPSSAAGHAPSPSAVTFAFPSSFKPAASPEACRSSYISYLPRGEHAEVMARDRARLLHVHVRGLRGAKMSSQDPEVHDRRAVALLHGRSSTLGVFSPTPEQRMRRRISSAWSANQNSCSTCTFARTLWLL